MLKRFVIALGFIGLLLGLASGAEMQQPDYAKAKVLEIRTVEYSSLGDSQVKNVSQQVTLQILSGKFKGRVVDVEHMASGGMMGQDLLLARGDRVMVYVDENPPLAESLDGSPLFNVADFCRDTPIFWLAFFYALLLIVVGGIKGFKSLLSLIITIALIFLIFFPLTLWGFDPLWVSVFIAGAVSLIVFRIIGGKTVKALSAAIGTILGVAIAGILACVVGKMVHLTGLSSEESKILLYSLDFKINYQGLLFGSILIGALGAVMDIGMSIASSIDEVRKVYPEANFKNLFNAGMNVGRDIMGTMSNTLILAYTGSTLPLLLLLVAGNIPFSKIINLEMIASELVRALAGSIGLILCIPITAVVSAFMYTEFRKK